MLLEITELHSRVLPLISPVAYDLLPLIRYHARLSTKREFSSGQPSTTNTKTPTRLSWGFFLGDRACCPVLLRVPAESCGPRPPRVMACSAPGFLSTGYFSQRFLRTVTTQSPQDPRFGCNKINNLQVDE